MNFLVIKCYKLLDNLMKPSPVVDILQMCLGSSAW
jgi:hypothetical protein